MIAQQRPPPPVQTLYNYVILDNFMCTPRSYIYVCSEVSRGKGWGGEGRGSTYKEGYLIYTVEGSPRSNSIHILLPNEYSFHTYIMNIITCNHSLQSEPEVTAGMYIYKSHIHPYACATLQILVHTTHKCIHLLHIILR